jgi:hypothetical protein
VASAGWQVRSGEDESPAVARDGLAEPFSAGLGADEDEQGVSWDGAPCSGRGVGQDQRSEVAGAGAGAAGDLHSVTVVACREVTVSAMLG